MITEQDIAEHKAHCDRSRDSIKGQDGPWMHEPDRVEFEHAGFQCLLSRNPSLLNWCGYVGIPPDHPDYEKSYDDVDSDVEVHGGLTYSEHCGGNICHITKGEDRLYWFGFDCGHSGDFVPGTNRIPGWPKIPGETYKGLGYVTSQTKRLAEQLAARMKGVSG